MNENKASELFADAAPAVEPRIISSDDLVHRGRALKRRRTYTAGLAAVMVLGAVFAGAVPLIASTEDDRETPVADEEDSPSERVVLPILSKGDWSSTDLGSEPRLDAVLRIDSNNCVFVLRDGLVYNAVWPRDYKSGTNASDGKALVLDAEGETVATEDLSFVAAGGSLERSDIALSCAVEGAQGTVAVLRVG